MPKCYVVHRIDKNNVGDIASNPLQYFLKPNLYQSIDINEIHTTYLDDKPIIAGGGGLINNYFFGDILYKLIQPSDKNQIANLANQYWQNFSSNNKVVRDAFFEKLNVLVAETISQLDCRKTPRIIWGAGHNGDYNKKSEYNLEYPDFLRNFDLVGLRDYNQQYQWVPCASCMHPALAKKYTIKNDVIWFEHKKQLVKSTDFGNDPIPRFINSGNNIEQTIEILGSANIIITNSYHGAYWGTLLNKKVIVYEPWSTKFFTMRHQPYMLSKNENWKHIVDEVATYDNALHECVTANQEYWNKVKGYL